MIGRRAPALPADGWLNGQRPEVAGKPYLVHFWAIWCGPCKGDLPLLRMLAGQGLTIVGVHSPGTPAAEVEKFTREQGLNYPTLLAAADTDNQPPRIGGYPVGLFPYCVLVDASGRVATHGPLSDVQRAASAALFLAKMAAAPTPALQASRWLNTATPLALDGLKGKTVLLDFWGQWCNPCVKNLPHCEELYAKFKDRGLVVIGVHTPNDSDKLDAFLKEKNVTFPVMVDQGETADRFQVNSWPTYVLIDKAGKIAWGFTHEPPSVAQVEELIAAKE
jgi:thiol-disulfide isomerase/thioredoxin